MSLKRSIFAGMLFIAVAFALILPTTPAQAFANVQCILTNSQTTLGNCIVAAIPLSLLGIALSLIIVGIAYMFGEVMNINSLKGWYRTELWETIKSGIIIIIVFSSLIIGSAIATSLAGNASTTTGAGSYTTAGTSITSNLASLYATANTAYLSPQLSNSVTAFSSLLGLSIGSNLLSTLNFSIWLPIPIPTPAGIIGWVEFGVGDTYIFQSNFIDQDTFSGAQPLLVQATSNIIVGDSFIVIFMVILFQLQKDLLISAAVLGLGVLLPLGIIMRAIPFVRGVGGTLIAAAIGLSIIYPAILVGFNLPVSQYILTLTSATATSKCPFTQYLLCQLYNSITFVTMSQPLLSAATNIPIMFAFGTAANNPTNSGLFLQGMIVGLTGPFINGIFPALNFVIDNSLGQIVQFLLLIMDAIMVYALTQGIARLMGGSIDLGDLAKGGLRLV